jgi:hypothetical protein
VPILKKLREQEEAAGVDVRIKSDMERAEATTEGSEDDHNAGGDRYVGCIVITGCNSEVMV